MIGSTNPQIASDWYGILTAILERGIIVEPQGIGAWQIRMAGEEQEPEAAGPEGERGLTW